MKQHKNSSESIDSQNSTNPNSPKNRIIRLVVGMVIITLGVVIFNISSKLYKEAEAKDAAEKEKREQEIRQITEPDSTETNLYNI